MGRFISTWVEKIRVAFGTPVLTSGIFGVVFTLISLFQTKSAVSLLSSVAWGLFAYVLIRAKTRWFILIPSLTVITVVLLLLNPILVKWVEGKPQQDVMDKRDEQVSIIKDGDFESRDLLRYWQSNERIREAQPLSSDNIAYVKPFVDAKIYVFDNTLSGGLSGTPGLRIFNKTVPKSGQAPFIRQRINVEPNTDYKIKFFVSGKVDSEESLRLAIGDRNWEKGVRVAPKEIPDAGWGNGIEKTIKTDSEERPNFYIISNSKVDLYLDNIAIEKTKS